MFTLLEKTLISKMFCIVMSVVGVVMDLNQSLQISTKMFTLDKTTNRNNFIQV